MNLVCSGWDEFKSVTTVACLHGNSLIVLQENHCSAFLNSGMTAIVA